MELRLTRILADMKMLFGALFLLGTLCGHAQDTARNITFTKAEVSPEYPGGKDAWNTFLAKNLHYPDDAISNGIGGDIVVQFIVDTAGNISDVEAISGPTKGGLREEAVRVVKVSGTWTPALQNGHKVRCYKKVPIKFKLSYG